MSRILFRCWAILCVSAVCLLLCPSAGADTVYTYTGQVLTDAGLPCGSPCMVTGTMTLATPLAPNLSGISIGPPSFSFTDGFSGWNNPPTPGQFVNSTVQFSDIDTDAAGNITSWAIEIVAQQIGCEPNNCVTLFLFINNDPDGSNVGDSAAAEAGGRSAGAAGNSTPGMWCTAGVPCGSSSVPEPGTFLLLGTGLGAVLLKRSRRTA